METAKSKQARPPDWSFTASASADVCLAKMRQITTVYSSWYGDITMTGIEQVTAHEYRMVWHVGGRENYDIPLKLFIEPLEPALTLIYGYRLGSGWNFVALAALFFLALPLMTQVSEMSQFAAIIGVLWLPGLLLAWLSPASSDTACYLGKLLGETLAAPAKGK